MAFCPPSFKISDNIIVNTCRVKHICKKFVDARSVPREEWYSIQPGVNQLCPMFSRVNKKEESNEN